MRQLFDSQGDHYHCHYQGGGGGCFWGVQYYFDQIPGVLESEVGYTGGQTENPTYEDVCTQQTGHAEAVKVTFDPDIVPYETLVKHFFRLHDPTQLNRQGPDVGTSYRSAIYTVSEDQKKVAEEIKATVSSEHDKRQMQDTG